MLNFGGLEYMNSGGIGMLVTLLVRANRQRQQLAAYGLSEHYREIFELTRLDEAITIYDDEASALAGAGDLRRPVMTEAVARTGSASAEQIELSVREAARACCPPPCHGTSAAGRPRWTGWTSSSGPGSAAPTWPGGG